MRLLAIGAGILTISFALYVVLVRVLEFDPMAQIVYAAVAGSAVLWVIGALWAAHRLDARTLELLASEDRFRALAERAAGGMIYRYRLTPSPGFVYVSSAAVAVSGYTPAEHFADPRLHSRLAYSDDRELLAPVWEAPETVQTAVTARWVRKDGEIIWTEQEVIPVFDSGGKVTGYDGYVRDVTARVRTEEYLNRQAFNDPLTGLPNRSLFLDRLMQALARSRRSGRPIAVMFMDLDRFKSVNDTLGHGGADQLLVAFGQRLKALLRPSDTLARFGGDEFTVLVEDIVQPEDAARVAERFIQALRRPFDIQGRLVSVTSSIGIAARTAGHDQPGDLLSDADTALYEAKATGRDRVILFHPGMTSRAALRQDLETDLRDAAGRGELRVYYQPEVDLATGDIVSVEALVRWKHPRHGMIVPDQFIGIAEETGLIVPIGLLVLEEACREATVFLQDCPDRAPVTVSVNLSARQLQQPDLVQQVATVLRDTGLEPSALRLEVRETAAMHDLDAATAVLHELKALGIRLVLDAFGAGASSLTSLQRFPLDAVKIDHSLLRHIGQDSRAAALVRAVSSLAHDLGMEVTAEGIETPDQRAGASAVHCDRGQGYCFARPLPSDWLRALLCTGLSPDTYTTPRA